MSFGIPIGAESSAVGLKVCIINAEIKNAELKNISQYLRKQKHGC